MADIHPIANQDVSDFPENVQLNEQQRPDMIGNHTAFTDKIKIRVPPDIAIPVFGYKAHIAIDRRHGVIRRRLVSDAAAHDGARLREGLINSDNTASGVWAEPAKLDKDGFRML